MKELLTHNVIVTAGSGSVMGFLLNLVIAYTITDVAEVIESDLVSHLLPTLERH